MEPQPARIIDVACLCAAWCRLCDSYSPVFEQVLAGVQAEWPQLQLRPRWIDIEDQADLVGSYDVETFPTIVIVDGHGLRFAGPLTPQPATLQRVLRANLGDAAGGDTLQDTMPEAAAFAQRLRANDG